jgi:hypothetical protein
MKYHVCGASVLIRAPEYKPFIGTLFGFDEAKEKADYCYHMWGSAYVVQEVEDGKPGKVVYARYSRDDVPDLEMCRVCPRYVDGINIFDCTDSACWDEFEAKLKQLRECKAKVNKRKFVLTVTVDLEQESDNPDEEPENTCLQLLVDMADDAKTSLRRWASRQDLKIVTNTGITDTTKA